MAMTAPYYITCINLNPLEKAKLAHLLARMPTTNAKLRRGDVARVTAFAIQRAGEGAEEVVDMITSNVQQPFAFSGANPDRKAGTEDGTAAKVEESMEDDKRATEKEDVSASMLIGLYLISDILSSSSTSGVSHAWRYRQLFENALKQKEVFEDLGRLDKKMHWGRLRAEKWKRSVGSVLTLWESWCVFPQDSHEHFLSMFTNPPVTAEEEAISAAAEKTVTATASKSRWKTVEEHARDAQAEKAQDDPVEAPSGELMDMDVDGEPMTNDENIDGEPMVEDNDDADGEPMGDSGNSHIPMDGTNSKAFADKEPIHTGGDQRSQETAKLSTGFQKGAGDGGTLAKSQPAGARRRRPRAEDMFADSD
ncbi:MAG: hypothetical protein LQ350_007111 [Teloschistes chrysophthalmus]|nr:MAG: hypothetical protein LQ350_007111 [Niorma chrysophthalma]